MLQSPGVCFAKPRVSSRLAARSWGLVKPWTSLQQELHDYHDQVGDKNVDSVTLRQYPT